MVKERRQDYPNIMEKIDGHTSCMSRLEKKIDKVFEILNGNGEMGIVAKVLSMETYIKGLQSSKGRLVEHGWKFVSGALLVYIAYRLGRG